MCKKEVNKTVKCQCGDPGCKVQLTLDGSRIFIIDKNGKEHLMYVDPNTIVDIAKNAHQMLLTFLTPDGGA